MARESIDELLHRINNLLSTISTQAEVASVTGTLAAHQQALRTIVESAERTHDQVRRFRRERGLTTRSEN